MTHRLPPILTALALGLAAVVGAHAAAREVTYELPEEMLPELPAGPGAELTAANCAACHSLDYITTQPRGQGTPFWHASVTKMVKVYHAPIEPADAEAIAAYLARTYG